MACIGFGQPGSHATTSCSSNIHVHITAPPGTQLPADWKNSVKVSQRPLPARVMRQTHRSVPPQFITTSPVSSTPPGIYPCILYSSTEKRLFWRRCCHGGTNVLIPPSPGSYLGEPLLVDMVHHHNLIIKRSTRPSRAAEGENQLHYEVQVIYIYANRYCPWRAICSLLLTPNPKQLKLI